MNRRDAVLALLATGAAPLSAIAQTAPRVRRIGYFALASAQSDATFLAAFRAGMLELGWADERDYVIEARYANGVVQAAPGLADELLASGPDLLLAPANAAVRLLAQRTKTLPIVFALAQDPVESGLAASLRKPGGNATGVTSMATELSGKRLQLLKEAFPRVAHVALLFSSNDAGSVSQAREIEASAPRLGLRVSPLELTKPADIEPAFKRAAALGAQACNVTLDGLTFSHRQVIADHIARLKVPGLFPGSAYVEAGGLMPYGASFTDNFRRAAAHADKILKGAQPGDLPIEQPTKFELAVNMKTARALGYKFPESFMLSVTRVIE